MSKASAPGNRNQPDQRKKQSSTVSSSILNTKSADIIPLLLLLLYTITGLIPPIGALKVIGPQWLYLSALNLLGIIFIFSRKNEFYRSAQDIARSIFSILYIALFVIVGISVYAAYNKTESLVSYSMMANTITGFFVVSLLIYRRLHLFRIVAQFLSIILFFESAKILAQFFNGLGDTDFDQLVLGLKGNAGNKNILAASLVVKIPFALYAARNSKWLGKGFHILTATIASFAIFFVSSRSAFIGLLLVLILFAAYSILDMYRRKGNAREFFTQTGIVVAPIVICFLLSQVIIKNAIQSQGKESAYGTLAQRLGSIGLSEESSNARTFYWKNAINYVKAHPLTGCGFGNWKLISIPMDKYYLNNYGLSYHVHNDFLEMSAESGLPAGLIYLGLFICLAIYGLLTWLSPSMQESRHISAFALMGLGAYFTDAVFNFPAEMPVMQVSFLILAAVMLNCFLETRSEKKPSKSRGISFYLILLPAFVITIIAGWISLNTFKSMVIQMDVENDLSKQQPELQVDYILHAFPATPNLNARGIPIDLFKANYLALGKRYDEALFFINKSKKSNPYSGVGELLRSKIYLDSKKPDSAYNSAVNAFFDKPRSDDNFQMLVSICYQRGDTAMLNKAFKEYIRYRNEPSAWTQYFNAVSRMAYDKNNLMLLIDSAAKLFPSDATLQGRITTLRSTLSPVQNIPVNNNAGTKPADTSSKQLSQAQMVQVAEGIKNFNEAQEAFNKTDYKTAAEKWKKAFKLNPTEFAAMENAGLCYYSLNDFKSAADCFAIVLKGATSKDGKAEFFEGMSMINLGKSKEGCALLQKAENKKYPEARKFMDIYCKTDTTKHN